MKTIATEAHLHDELLSLYRRTGEATGYWPSYFLREVRAKGGLAVARRLLHDDVSSGFERLAQSQRVDLSIEAIALSDRFRHLFSATEREVARQRLANLPTSAFPSENPDTFADVGQAYPEGAVERVRVNRYERSASAREACIRHHGARCAVCTLSFEDRYGPVGRGFIHVHHRRSLASLSSRYRVNPVRDLVPVCPNCHAMLHRREPPYDVEQLRTLLRET